MSFSTSDYLMRQVYLTVDETDDEITVKEIGRLSEFLYCDKRCLGVGVNCPDGTLKVKRKEVFVPLSSMIFQDKTIILNGDFEGEAEKFLEKHKDEYESASSFEGMIVQCKNGVALGKVESVVCEDSGDIKEFRISEDGTSEKLLGLRRIPVDLFVGIETRNLIARDAEDNDKEAERGPVFVVKDEAEDIDFQGGASEKLAVGSVKAKEKAIEAAKKAKIKAMPFVEKGKDKAVELAKMGAAKAVEKATPVIESGKETASDLAQEGKQLAKEQAEKKTEEIKVGLIGF